MNTVETTPEFEALLEYLKRTRSFDLTGYKRSTLVRRVNRRMQRVGVKSYSEYLGHLSARPAEFTSLFHTVLINVTSFFRGRVVWEYLAMEVIPRILSAKAHAGPIRVWSAAVPLVRRPTPWRCRLLRRAVLSTSGIW